MTDLLKILPPDYRMSVLNKLERQLSSLMLSEHSLDSTLAYIDNYAQNDRELYKVLLIAVIRAFQDKHLSTNTDMFGKLYQFYIGSNEVKNGLLQLENIILGINPPHQTNRAPKLEHYFKSGDLKKIYDAFIMRDKQHHDRPTPTR